LMSMTSARGSAAFREGFGATSGKVGEPSMLI